MYFLCAHIIPLTDALCRNIDSGYACLRLFSIFLNGLSLRLIQYCQIPFWYYRFETALVQQSVDRDLVVSNPCFVVNFRHNLWLPALVDFQIVRREGKNQLKIQRIGTGKDTQYLINPA